MTNRGLHFMKHLAKKVYQSTKIGPRYITPRETTIVDYIKTIITPPTGEFPGKIREDQPRVIDQAQYLLHLFHGVMTTSTMFPECQLLDWMQSNHFHITRFQKSHRPMGKNNGIHSPKYWLIENGEPNDVKHK